MEIVQEKNMQNMGGYFQHKWRKMKIFVLICSGLSCLPIVNFSIETDFPS